MLMFFFRNGGRPIGDISNSDPEGEHTFTSLVYIVLLCNMSSFVNEIYIFIFIFFIVVKN